MSKIFRGLAVLLIAAVLLGVRAQWGAGSDPELYEPDKSLYDVELVDYDWVDESRERPVPSRVYFPKAGDPGSAQYPVVVLSHGLWGSRAGYEYFGRHMARHGYIVIAPTHQGSSGASATCVTCDLGMLLDALTESRYSDRGLQLGLLPGTTEDPENLRNRPLDVSFVLDQLSREPRLQQFADPTRIGVAGHSFGAFTAMAAAGMVVTPEGGSPESYADPRVKTVLLMSAPGPGSMGITEGAWEQFKTPAMFLTGSRDYGSGPRADEWRKTPFRSIRGVDRYMVTLEGAQHATFGRMAERADTNGGGPAARHLSYIKAFSAAFFDAYLSGQPEAHRWLDRFGDGSSPAAFEVETG